MSISIEPRKQTEARHAKALEAAEEKFQKAFDRVKRAAIEAPRKQDRAGNFTVCQCLPRQYGLADIWEWVPIAG